MDMAPSIERRIHRGTDGTGEHTMALIVIPIAV
jgi:hypothetical protein